MSDLTENKFLGIVPRLGLPRKLRNKFLDLVYDLRDWDEHTAYHSMRESVIGFEFAKYKGYPVNMYTIPPALHDRGKRYIPKEILRASSSKDIEWKDEYMDIMKNHVLYGYADLIRNGFPFSAGVALLHHLPNYPEKLPNLFIPYTRAQMKDIEKVSEHISVLDFYDSITNRDNGRFDGNIDIRETILENMPQNSKIINELYDAGIFTELILSN